MARTPPTIDEARLAAGAVAAEAGAVRVMLFGSVARGTADRGSDINLMVLVPEAVAYCCSGDRDRALSAAASDAVGRRVSVMVHDVSTWNARIQMPIAVDSEVAAEAVTLIDALDPDVSCVRYPPGDLGTHPAGLPMDAAGELARRLGALRGDIFTLRRAAECADGESDAGPSGLAERATAVIWRSLIVAWSPAVGSPPPHQRRRQHSALIDALPEPERSSWQALVDTHLAGTVDEPTPQRARALGRLAVAAVERTAAALVPAGVDADLIAEVTDAARAVHTALQTR